jgi:hypothetical protein
VVSHDIADSMIRPASTAPRMVRAASRPSLRQSFIPRASYNTAPTHRFYIAAPVVPRTYVAQHRAAFATMASATSFFEFKPKDSTSPHAAHALTLSLLTVRRMSANARHREGRSLPSVEPPEQGRSRRQHGVEMRLHAPVRRPGEAVQRHQGQAPE